MKSLFTTSMSGIIALFITFAINTQCAAQSTIMAEQFAYDASVKLMKTYCPSSGSDASASVSQAEYDYSSDRYIMKITATWYGKPCWLCSYGTFRIDGILQVNKDGSRASFNPTYKSTLVKDNEDYTKYTRGAVALGVLAAAASSSSR